jgi:hypothetical protein
VYRGPNPPYGALITYSLKETLEKKVPVELEIVDSSGRVIRTIKNIPKEGGIHRIAWDLRLDGPRPRRQVRVKEDFFTRGPRGPLAIPGTYTARLTAGENTSEKSFKVRLDPTVRVSQDDLEIQQQYSIQLIDMQSFVNDGLRALDILEKQIEERKETLNRQRENIPKEVMEAVEKHSKRIESLQDFLARPEGTARWSEGPRLIGRLSRLFRSIDGVNAPPTKAQRDYFSELEEEFRKNLTEVNRYLGQSVKDLNKTFRKFQVPLLLLPEPVKIPEK